MKNTIKTLALTTAVIGLATVIKRKKEQPAGTGHPNIIDKGQISSKRTKIIHLKNNLDNQS